VHIVDVQMQKARNTVPLRIGAARVADILLQRERVRSLVEPRFQTRRLVAKKAACHSAGQLLAVDTKRSACF
jgi:hypothetical protein